MNFLTNLLAHLTWCHTWIFARIFSSSERACNHLRTDFFIIKTCMQSSTHGFSHHACNHPRMDFCYRQNVHAIIYARIFSLSKRACNHPRTDFLIVKTCMQSSTHGFSHRQNVHAIIHRCSKYLDCTFLQYETRTSRAGQLKILSFYAFLGLLHICALSIRKNKEN